MLAGNFSSNWSRYVENIISSFFHLFFIPFSFILFSFFFFSIPLFHFFFFFFFFHIYSHARFLSVNFYALDVFFAPKQFLTSRWSTLYYLFLSSRAHARSSGAILQSLFPPFRNDIFRRNFKCFNATGTITICASIKDSSIQLWGGEG